MTPTPVDKKNEALEQHQSQLRPEENKFHKGNGSDGKHYWITPPDLYAQLDAQYHFDFDPCPFPKPDDFDGLTCEWGKSSYVNPPFGSIMHNGKKKGATAWVRKAIEENKKGKRVVFVHPMDKWVLMMIAAGAKITNLGDVKWLATEDGSVGKGTGRHIACFVLDNQAALTRQSDEVVKQVSDYMRRSIDDHEFHMNNAPVGSHEEAYHQGALQKAQAILSILEKSLKGGG